MADDTYYNEPIKWLPVIKTALVHEQVKQLQEEISKRFLMPMILPKSDIFAQSYGYSYTPAVSQAQIRLELELPPIKFIGINFTIDDDAVVLERPDAEWNF